MIVFVLITMLFLAGCHMNEPGPPKKCTKIASVPGKVLVECSHTLDGDR